MRLGILALVVSNALPLTVYGQSRAGYGISFVAPTWRSPLAWTAGALDVLQRGCLPWLADDRDLETLITFLLFAGFFALLQSSATLGLPP